MYTEEERIEQLTARNQVITDALVTLVEVKAHKDICGKTPWYEENMPKAWEKARKALGDSVISAKITIPHDGVGVLE